MVEGETTVEGPRRRISRPGALDVLAVVIVAVGLLLADALVGEVRAVESTSMAPTLMPGERVAIAKAGVARWQVPRGTIVVFDGADLWVPADAPGGTVFVKRVIAVSGDRVRCCSPSGHLVLNGSELDEPYLRGAPTDQVAFDVVVEDGHYWLLGDNRAQSSDARDHLGGPGGGSVPASRIIGTVRAVAWPLAAIRRVEG